MHRPKKTKKSPRKSGYNTCFSARAVYYFRLLCYLPSIWNTRGWPDVYWRAVWKDLLCFWTLSHSLLGMSVLMSPKTQQRPKELFWILQSFRSTGAYHFVLLCCEHFLILMEETGSEMKERRCYKALFPADKYSSCRCISGSISYWTIVYKINCDNPSKRLRSTSLPELTSIQNITDKSKELTANTSAIQERLGYFSKCSLLGNV